MTVIWSARAYVLERIRATYTPQPIPAGAPQLKGPQDVLGAKPNRSIRFTTRAAEALAGPDAARMQPPVQGGRIDVFA